MLKITNHLPMIVFMSLLWGLSSPVIARQNSLEHVSIAIDASVVSKVVFADQNSHYTPITAEFTIGQEVTLHLSSTGYMPVETHFKVARDSSNIFVQMVPDPRWKRLEGDLPRFWMIRWFQGNFVFIIDHASDGVNTQSYTWSIYSPETKAQLFSQNSPFSDYAVNLKKQYPFLDLVTAKDLQSPPGYLSPDGETMLYLRPVYEGERWVESTFWFADLKTGYQVDTKVPGNFNPRAIVWSSENEAFINSDNYQLEGKGSYIFRRHNSNLHPTDFENWSDANYTLYPWCKEGNSDEFNEHIHSPEDIQLLHSPEFTVTSLLDFKPWSDLSTGKNGLCALQAVAVNSIGRYVLMEGCCLGEQRGGYLLYDRLLGKVQYLGGMDVAAGTWIDADTVRIIEDDAVVDYDVATGKRKNLLDSDEWDTTISNFSSISPDGRYIATVHEAGGDLRSETVLVRNLDP